MNPDNQQNPNQQPNFTPPEPITAPPQNPMPQTSPQVPQYQNAPAPQLTTQPVMNMPQTMVSPFSIGGSDAKIGSAKNLLTIFGVMGVYILISVAAALLFKPLGYLSYVIYLVLMVLAFKTVTKLKNKGVDDLAEDEKYRMVFFMSVDPLIAQAFYYYRLRKTMPHTAKIASKIGWKVFFLGFIPGTIAAVALLSVLAISGVQTVAWNNAYEAKFAAATTLVSDDLSAAGTAIQSSDTSGLQSSCSSLKNDVESLKQIPAYPVQAVQNQLNAAYTSLENGSNDCLNGIKNQDSQLLGNAGSELNSGITALNTPIKTIQANTKK